VRISEQKTLHLSNLIYNLLKKHNALSINDDVAVRGAIKQIIIKEDALDSHIDEFVRKKIASYRRKIIEGTAEWDVLYRKFFNEEMDKKTID